MLRLELVDNTNDKVIYNYFPEGKEEYGIVSVNKNTGDLNVEKIAVNDEYKRYLFHAMSRIRKFFSENRFSEKETVAWY